MSGVFGLAGWHFCTFLPNYTTIPMHDPAYLNLALFPLEHCFSFLMTTISLAIQFSKLIVTSLPARSPTSSSSENPVAKVAGSEPWKTGGSAKYQYHPGGDTSQPRKDAPSALNEVIIPNVNLPKVCQRVLRGGWLIDRLMWIL